MRRLSLPSLAQINTHVATPLYDLDSVTCGILHLGVGNFHRAHQAVATDDALAAGEVDWGIAGVSLRSAGQRDALAPQDGLYSLTLRDDAPPRRRIIGALREMHVLSEAPQAIIRRIADPCIRIISLTVTEKGYGAEAGSGALRENDPEIAADLSMRAPPRTTLGLLASGLAERARSGGGSISIMSCDNLAANGPFLQRALTDFISITHADLTGWVSENVTFPATMVDRIVPATTEQLREDVSRAIGLVDFAPVEAEPFFQWVIEDNFVSGRPDWSRSGAQFVNDVEAFEHMKLRLLNGAHTTLASAGRLAGCKTVSDAMAVSRIRQLIEALWTESGATLPRNVDVSDYTSRLVTRFQNPALRHQLEQISTDGSQKVSQRLLAPLQTLRQKGRPHRALVLAVAAWLRSCQGRDDTGCPLLTSDPALDELPRDPNAHGREIVPCWLSHKAIFGDLDKDTDLTAQIIDTYALIATRGIGDAIEITLSDTTSTETRT